MQGRGGNEAAGEGEDEAGPGTGPAEGQGAGAGVGGAAAGDDVVMQPTQVDGSVPVPAGELPWPGLMRWLWQHTLHSVHGTRA